MCGAPIHGPSCLYCGNTFESPQDSKPKSPRVVPKGLFEVRVGRFRYAVLGELARGERCQILLARRAHAVTEQVVIKIAPEGVSLKREGRTLLGLHKQGAFHGLFPQVLVSSDIKGRSVLIYRWRCGFVYNMARVRVEYPQGVPPEASVWMWNRILDQLTYLRECDYTHGALQVEHILVNPRDHGVALCGWSKAHRGEGDDLAASARCIATLLGPNAPKPLQELTRCAYQLDSISELKTELNKVARALFGPPKFRTFTLPRVSVKHFQ